MAVNDRRSRPRGTGDFPPTPGAAAAGPDAAFPAGAVERRPVLRLAPGRAPALAAERVVVSRRALAAGLGPAAADDEDLLRHAADRVAARLPAALFSPGAAGTPLGCGGHSARVPVLLPLPLRPFDVAAPRPGLVGVLPPAAAAPVVGGASLPERRAELAALGWRLGVGELDAAALRFVDLSAWGAAADVLLLRWSPALAREWDALRGADPQALVLAGCDGADAVEWGQRAGLLLFSGPAAEAMAPSPAEAAA